MAVHVTRDFDSNEIVIRIKRGPAAGGFARFLDVAAEGLENGKILPTNQSHNGSITKAADQVRAITRKIHAHNA